MAVFIFLENYPLDSTFTFSNIKLQLYYVIKNFFNLLHAFLFPNVTDIFSSSNLLKVSYTLLRFSKNQLLMLNLLFYLNNIIPFFCFSLFPFSISNHLSYMFSSFTFNELKYFFYHKYLKVQFCSAGYFPQKIILYMFSLSIPLIFFPLLFPNSITHQKEYFTMQITKIITINE